MYKRILKKLRNELAELLRFALSLKPSSVPEGWQVSGVYPIFRPVSITSAHCKWSKQEFKRE